MPMDDGPRIQVEGLRDRIADGVIAQKKAFTFIIIVAIPLALPWWFSLAITYYQPIGRATLCIAMYKTFRGWSKVGAANVVSSVITMTRKKSAAHPGRRTGSLFKSFSRKKSNATVRGSVKTTKGAIVPKAWGSSAHSSHKYGSEYDTEQHEQALEVTEALRRALSLRGSQDSQTASSRARNDARRQMDVALDLEKGAVANKGTLARSSSAGKCKSEVTTVVDTVVETAEEHSTVVESTLANSEYMIPTKLRPVGWGAWRDSQNKP